MVYINPNDIPDFEITEEQRKNIRKAVVEDDEKETLAQLAANHEKEIIMTDEQVVDVFPTDQNLVVEKLEEYWDEATGLFRYMRQVRNIVDNVQADPFSKWFFVNAEKYKEGARLKWLYQQIKRLEHLKVVYEKKRVEALLKFVKFDTKEERKRYNIDKIFARENLLLDIVVFDGRKMKGVGSRFTGLCPFHKEDTPSFCVYADNWGHCYGCGWHGNIFDYLMKMRSIEFKEALAEADRFL